MFDKNQSVMQEITLTVTIEEANLILEALGDRPFKTVFSLIGKIQAQAAGQLNGGGKEEGIGKEEGGGG